MISVKTIKVNTELSIVGNRGVINSKVSVFENLPLQSYLNLSTSKRQEFYKNCNPGDLVIYFNSESEVYLDINKEGELIAIYPNQYNLSINSSGELLISL